MNTIIQLHIITKALLTHSLFISFCFYLLGGKNARHKLSRSFWPSIQNMVCLPPRSSPKYIHILHLSEPLPLSLSFPPSCHPFSSLSLFLIYSCVPHCFIKMGTWLTWTWSNHSARPCAPMCTMYFLVCRKRKLTPWGVETSKIKGTFWRKHLQNDGIPYHFLFWWFALQTLTVNYGLEFIEINLESSARWFVCL